jgi:hypothetical protein
MRCHPAVAGCVHLAGIVQPRSEIMVLPCSCTLPRCATRFQAISRSHNNKVKICGRTQS